LPYATIGLPVALIDCCFDETVELSDASFRAVDLTGSSLPGLRADRLRVDGDLVLARLVSGSISLFRADVGGDLWLHGAEVTGEGTGYAVNAPQLRIGGGLYARSLRALGGLNLWGAQAFTLEVSDGFLSSSACAALRGDGFRMAQDLRCSGLSVGEGGISLFGSAVGGQCWFDDARISSIEGWAVNAPLVTVGGGFYGRGMTVHGGINLFAATVGESLELSGCTLTSHHRRVLRAPGARIEADIDLGDGATVTGDVALMRAEIKGTLRLSGAAFTEGSSINLQRATLGALDMTSLHTLPSACDLRAATIGRIDDSPGSWPPRIELDAMTYQELDPVLPSDQRLTWLERGEGYNAQPYTYLAAHYRKLGHEEDARSVQLARHRQRNRSARRSVRLWGHLEDLTVGYGYRPGRALGSLVLLTAIIAVVFAAVPPRPARSDGPTFQPVAFALDVVLPVLDLGQEKAFIPSGGTSWVAWAGAVTGWLLATAVIAGLTRRLSRPGS
jgi:hypothetical protein